MAIPTNGTTVQKVTMHLKGKTTGVMGTIMGPMIEINLKKSLGQSLSDFKYYLENNKPSPEKIKNNNKNKKK